MSKHDRLTSYSLVLPWFLAKNCYFIEEEVIVSVECERVLVQDAASVCLEKELENAS